MLIYQFYWPEEFKRAGQVAVPGADALGNPGRHVLKLSPGGFVRVEIAPDQSLSTYVTWLETHGFIGHYAPERIVRITDVWVSDLAETYQFVPDPQEPPA